MNIIFVMSSKNPNKPEEVGKFMDQITESLDFRISKLREHLKEQAELLETLKGQILTEISNPKTGAIKDLTLNSRELQQVFDKLFKQNEALFVEAGVADYGAFCLLLGLEGPLQIGLVDREEKLQISGQEIEIELPLDVGKRSMKFYQLAVKQIEQCEALKPYLNSISDVAGFDISRLEFTLVQDGKKVRYCASPDGVFRVDEEAFESVKNEYVKKSLQENKLRRSLKEKMKNGSQSEYLKLLDEIVQLSKEVTALGLQCGHRLLFDLVNQKNVQESAFGNTYNLDYLNDNGVRQRTIRYVDGEKHSEELIDPKTGFQESMVFYKNGVRDKMETDDLVYQYDKKGEQVIYILGTGWAKIPDTLFAYKQRILVADNGKDSIGPFFYEKSKNPGLSEEEYLKQFKKIVKTKEQYYAFEELPYQDAIKMHKNLNEALREYGKEICGIKKLLDDFERKYSIGIEIDGVGFFGLSYDSGKASLGAIEHVIPDLARLIDMYPPGFVNRFVNKIYLRADNISSSNGNFGGVATHTRLMIGLPSNDRIFHHEFFHCIDSADGLTFDDNAWGLGAYGEDYRQLYGQDVGNTNITPKVIPKDEKPKPRPSGFPSAYAREAVSEDQAEMSAHLMIKAPAVLRAMKNEHELKLKAEMIRKCLYEKSDGMIDRQFWKDLYSGVKIDRAYWRKRAKHRPKREPGMTYLGV